MYLWFLAAKPENQNNFAESVAIQNSMNSKDHEH